VINYSPLQWIELGRMVLWKMPLGIFAGIAALFFVRLRLLLLGALLMGFLWLSSIGWTLGGVEYSSRVLGAAAALLSICAGVLLDRVRERRPRVPVAGVLGFLIALTLVGDCFFPAKISMIPRGQRWSRILTRQHFQYRRVGLRRTVARYFSPGERILSLDAYSHVRLMDSFNPSVIVWSPEVAFLFDFSLSPADIRRRLGQLGINGVVFPSSGDHASFFESFPFFRDAHDTWIPLEEIKPSATLYRINP